MEDFGIASDSSPAGKT